jgi:hypothetical protein
VELRCEGRNLPKCGGGKDRKGSGERVIGKGGFQVACSREMAGGGDGGKMCGSRAVRGLAQKFARDIYARGI